MPVRNTTETQTYGQTHRLHEVIDAARIRIFLGGLTKLSVHGRYWYFCLYVLCVRVYVCIYTCTYTYIHILIHININASTLSVAYWYVCLYVLV